LSKIEGIDQKLLSECVRCGACRHVCPVFNITKEEPSVARGKIFLAEQVNRGALKIDKEVADIFSLCTTCLRCSQICPVMVDYESLILSARARAVEEVGLDLKKRAVVNLFSNEKLLSLSKFTSPLVKLFTKEAPSPSIRLLPFKDMALPNPSSKPFNAEERVFEAEGKEKGRLLFFTGCMFNHFFTETALNTVKVLNRLGYTVVVPKGQSCCGAPALFSGERQKFKEMKEKNLKLFSDKEADFIITACATCGHVLKREYRELPLKTLELIELLYEEREELKKWELPEELTLTWHFPCHMVRGQKIPQDYVLEVLSSVKNLRFKPMEEADNCCGMGGTFKISHPEISAKIQEKKATNIDKSGAEFVATECPGCVLNIAEGLARKNSSIKSVHISDILARARVSTCEEKNSL